MKRSLDISDGATGGRRAGRGTGPQAVRQRTQWFPRVSERQTSLLVLVLLGGAAALAVAQIVLLAVTWSAPTGQELPDPVSSIGFVIGSFSFSLIGALIAWNRPANAIGWLCLGLAVVDLGQDILVRYLAYTLLVAPDTSLPPLTAAGSLLPAAWLAPASCFLLLLIVFPSGRPSSRWMNLVAWVIPLLAASSLALSAIQPGTLPPPFEQEENVLGIAGADGSADLALALTIAIAVLGLLAAVDMVRRFRRSTGDERQQFKWFAYLTGWVPVLLLVWNALLALDPDRVSWIEAVFPFLLVSIPAAIGTSVLKYRLYDIDVVINRTLVYGALSACIVVCYALTVGALGAVFRAQGDLAISLVATGVVGVLFQPLRERLQRGVNRLMYGERDDPYAVLARLGRRLEATLTPDTVLPTIVQMVKEALKLPYVAISLATDPASDPPVVTTAGTPVRETLRLPLVYQHEPVGALLLAPRAPGEPFSPADRRLLDDLARQAGVAVHAVRLTADLQLSRERLVTAREEERRRLRRDLHDGLGPALASMALQTEAARELSATNAARADGLLADLTEQLQAATADIRRLVYDLRPPALDELGLVRALRAQAARQELGRTRIEVRAPEALPPLPAAVEVAAYRIAQEALTNVLRHAAADRCLVTLNYDEQAALLTVEVTDDGRGLPPETRAGVGLTSMRERAEELSGSCTVEALPDGGTRVRAMLPCPAPDGEVSR